MMIKIKIIFVCLIFFLFIGCINEKEKNWVAKVGGITISEQEYQTRLNFSAFLSDIKDEEKIKKIVLSALIAEKVLAKEALNNNYSSDILESLIWQNQKEVMIEYLRSDSVDNQVHITDAEVLLDYKRKTRELEVKYISISDFEKASQLRKLISSGKSFEDVSNAYIADMNWQENVIPTKTIKWYLEQPEMEHQLYNLDEGATSDPISAFGEYYLVKVDKINIVQSSLESSFDNKKDELKSSIRKNKIAKKYVDFYSKNILNRMGKADWKIIETAVDYYIQSLPAVSDINQLKSDPLPENVLFNTNEKISSLKSDKAIEFDDYSWTIEELFSHLRNGPYLFDMENTISIKKSFKRNIQLMLEHEAWYNLAIHLNYDYDPRVKSDHEVWSNYFYAMHYQQALDDTYKSGANLFELSEKFDIGFNKELYKKAKFMGQNIYLQKQHFANRSATPPLLAFGDNPGWQNKMNNLLAKEELN